MGVAFASSSRGRGSKKRAQNSMIAATGALYNAARAGGPAEGDKAEGVRAEVRKRASGVAAGVPAEQLGTERRDLVAAEGFEASAGPAEIGQSRDRRGTNAALPESCGAGNPEAGTPGGRSEDAQGQEAQRRARFPCTKPAEGVRLEDLLAVVEKYRELLDELKSQILPALQGVVDNAKKGVL